MATYAEMAILQQAMEDSRGSKTPEDYIQEDLDNSHSNLQLNQIFDKVSTSNPSVIENRDGIDNIESWVNISTGEIFICVDKTDSNNIWIGQMGTIVSPTSESLSDNLVAHFDFDTLDGNTITDSTGNIEAIVSGALIQRGLVGNAFYFNGTTDVRISGDSYKLQLVDDLSISFWINPRAFNKVQSIIDKCYDGEFSIIMNKDASISFLCGNKGTANSWRYDEVRTPKKSLYQKNWSHLTFARVKVSGKMYAILNGVLVAEIDTQYAWSISTSNFDVTIGSGSDANFVGSLDDLYIHAKCLSIKENSLLYNKGVTNVN